MNGIRHTAQGARIGFVGAGRMGQPMIGHVARNGYDVSVYDIDAGKKAVIESKGGKWVDLPTLATSCEIVLICVGYDRELRELLSVGGGLEGLAKGSIVAVLSTVHPKTVVELAEMGAQLGVHVVDSTVCRGGKAADDGTLLSFVGGDADVVSRLESVIRCYSSDVVHTGGVGTAQVAKAANNMIMWSCLIANHEALALAQRYGVDPDKLRESLLMSSGDNYVLRNWKVNTMAWAEDDMEIVQAMAAEKGIGLAQAGLNREICRTLKPKRFKLEQYGT
jgi:3-hydroxyisobutyrate dehydrogenase